jgi:hypothetical protein
MERGTWAVHILDAPGFILSPKAGSHEIFIRLHMIMLESYLKQAATASC